MRRQNPQGIQPTLQDAQPFVSAPPLPTPQEARSKAVITNPFLSGTDRGSGPSQLLVTQPTRVSPCVLGTNPSPDGPGPAIRGFGLPSTKGSAVCPSFLLVQRGIPPLLPLPGHSPLSQLALSSLASSAQVPLTRSGHPPAGLPGQRALCNTHEHKPGAPPSP